ncbi:MAG: hypothetical protein WA747_07360 [Steroidobacteraceae bacterium]
MLPQAIGDISGLHRYLQSVSEMQCLDRQTWSDLDGDSLCAALAGTGSLFAQSVAFDRLNGRTTRSMTDGLASGIRALQADRATTGCILQKTLPLKSASPDAVGMLFNFPLDKDFRWEWVARILPLVFVAGAASMIASLATGAVVLAIFGAGVFFVQSRLYAEMEMLSRLEDEVRRLLGVVLGLSSVPSHGHAVLERVSEHVTEAKLLFKGMRQSRVLSGLPEAEEYANWLFLRNIRRYLRIRPRLQRHLPLLRTCFEIVGEVELSATLASRLHHRAAASCWVTWTGDCALSFESTTHPVLSDAVPISLHLQGGGALVTGQNTSGKSTLLRSIGLNLICARAFGFCSATRATVPYLPVYTSISIEDRLHQGDSLFAAEVARAHEMWQAALSEPGLFLIDEVFRGTNHAESVSAAIGLLEGLAEHGLVVATTHNVELAQLLNGKFVFLVTVRTPGSESPRFELRPGVLEKTNALDILRQSNFGAGMFKRIAEVRSALSPPFTEDESRPADSDSQEAARIRGRESASEKQESPEHAPQSGDALVHPVDPDWVEPKKRPGS